MVRWLNKIFFFILFAYGQLFSQENECQKYQDKSKFARKAKYLAAWQIQQLKKGAVIIRIPDEVSKIKQLINKGQEEAAAIRYEKYVRKYKNRYRAFVTEFSFCRFYFLFAKDYPRLLRGERSGFFLDSTLCLNDTLQMKEDFFMILEEDDVYASTIGFVKESCADKVMETGPPVLHADWVFKNKYGHQVKDPFPMYFRNIFARNLYFERKYSHYSLRLCDTVYQMKSISVKVPEAQYREDYQTGLVREIQQRLESFYQKNQSVQIPKGIIDDYMY
jgi:hypothetical protein